METKFWTISDPLRIQLQRFLLLILSMTRMLWHQPLHHFLLEDLTLTPDILKPDVTAPGVDILAAWSPMASPSEDDYDPRRVTYNIISGTSMSCPHVTAAAAYVKAAHPNWYAAAIKSALMTTAHVLDSKKHVDLELWIRPDKPSESSKPGSDLRHIRSRLHKLHVQTGIHQQDIKLDHK